MFKLIKLELKRNNIKTYVIASSVTFIVMLGFIYLFAYAPQINPDPDLQIFAGYPKIISLFSTLSMAVFATLSATCVHGLSLMNTKINELFYYFPTLSEEIKYYVQN